MNAHTRLPVALRKRQAVEEHNQALIDMLDLLDGDPEHEPEETDQDIADEPHDEVEEGNDEPTLGWNEAHCIVPSPYGQDGELEPSLGSIGSCIQAVSHTVWASGGRSDREIDGGDERELDTDLLEAGEEDSGMDDDERDGDGEFSGGCINGADAPHSTTDDRPTMLVSDRPAAHVVKVTYVSHAHGSAAEPERFRAVIQPLR